jgi:tetratricopeptide (TPR) repeat protein
MARKPPRGAEDWFDKDLVTLVDALFASAARAHVDGTRLFAPGGNNAPRPSAVRELFGISTDEMSRWRRQDWLRAAEDKPLRFAETLCAAFDLHGPSSGIDAALAAKVRQHWQADCADDHADVVTRLRSHRLEQETKYVRGPLLNRESVVHSAGTGGGGASRRVVPMALMPPAGRDPPRPTALAQLGRLAADHFGVVIEGRARSGKRDLASAFALQHAQGQRLLWFRLAPTTALADLLARLASIDDPLNAQPDEGGSALVDWLAASETILVLDGLDHSNRPSFAPLLRLAAELPGPARLLATSLVRTNQASSFQVPPLTAAEAEDVFAQMGIEPAEGAIAMVCSDAIPPSALRRAASLYGRIDRDTLAAVMEERQAEMVQRAPLALQPVIEVLQLLEVDFDRTALELVLEALEVETAPRDVLASLEALLLVTPSSASTWRSEIRSTTIAPVTMSRPRLLSVITLLSDHYAAKVEPGRQEQTPEACANLYAALHLLQLADAEPRRRLWLRRQFASAMEKHGGFRLLAGAYRYEHEAGDDADVWLPYRLARAEFALGRYAEALDVLGAAIGRSLLRRGNRDETLHLSLLRLLAEVLIEADEPMLALRVLDKAIAAVKVQDIQSTACMQAVSCLSGALVQAGMPDACIEVNREMLDRRFEGLAPAFGLQISNVRVGVALRALGDLEASIDALRQAREYFATEDARAFAWSTLNLAVSLDEAGRFGEAAAGMSAALEVNAAHDFFSGDLQETYERFLKRADVYDKLSPALRSELQRIAAREEARRNIIDRIRGERVVTHVLIDLGVSLAEPYVFNLETYEIFSVRKPFRIASDFSRSLVRHHRRGGGEDALDAIFASKTPEEIFRTPLHNQLIVNTCKDQAFLAKKYILPHRELIGRQSDSIIFFYARCLEAIGHQDVALSLLASVRDQTVFSYFNITANCLAKTAPGEALAANDAAYAVGNRQQKAQVLNNKANIVLEHDLRSRFSDALAWCEDSIRLANKNDFYWPRNNLLRLLLETCAIEDAHAILAAHRQKFRPPVRALREIIGKVQRRQVREVALAALDA